MLLRKPNPGNPLCCSVQLTIAAGKICLYDTELSVMTITHIINVQLLWISFHALD